MVTTSKNFIVVARVYLLSGSEQNSSKHHFPIGSSFSLLPGMIDGLEKRPYLDRCMGISISSYNKKSGRLSNSFF